MSTKSKADTTSSSTCPDSKKQVLDSARLIGMTRIGQAAVSSDGTTAVFEVRDYDFTAKKFNEQLWRADLSMIPRLSDDEIKNHAHLVQLTAGSAHGWTTAQSPQFSPCGDYVAFLSNRPTGISGSAADKKSSVWILPVKGPGEARLLAEFPVSVGDLDWTKYGITVSASVYVDQDAVVADPMTVTADRDKALADADGSELGGLNAVLYKKLPIREWDRWLDAKMAHPFYFPVEKTNNQYTCDTTATTMSGGSGGDLLRGVPTAVPSGAFGGGEDWSLSNAGHVAVSARPPLATDEAWTTNRHIYLLKNHLLLDANNKGDNKPSETRHDDDDDDMDGLLGECLTAGNPGFDTTPTFSPDGNRLAWLTMAGPTYEADAVGIQVHDVTTGVTSTLLQAQVDWDYSPNSLKWSKDGTRLYFTADVRSRQALCSIDAKAGAGGTGGIVIHQAESSTSLHAECGTTETGNRQFLTTVQSLTMPSELFLTTIVENGATLRQLTHFNTDRIADTTLGRPGEIIYKGGKNEDVQAWLIRPAGLSQEDEDSATVGSGQKQYPLAVIYHGGPQGSTGDDWHYRWNLQYYASMGFAVLAPNFHGSTGFGHEFCREISGNWEIGGVDTIAGVRAALERYPWIDPKRVVGLGASYGGFTSNWLNGNAPKDMFQALVCHCGTFDLRSSYYATEELFFMETEFGGPAYTDRSLQSDSPYQIHTPSKKVHEWETPTLVIHGARDYRLVESEGISTFTALQRRNIPSELLYLPTENHHCLNPQNSMVWHETVLGWIKKWTTLDK